MMLYALIRSLLPIFFRIEVLFDDEQALNQRASGIVSIFP